MMKAHLFAIMVASGSVSTPAEAGLGKALRNGLARQFEKRARKTGRRVFHPYGKVFEGTFQAGAALSGVGAAHPVKVRFSQGIKEPGVARDIMGTAIKLTDYHGPGRDQDFLTIAVRGPGRLARRIPTRLASFFESAPDRPLVSSSVNQYTLFGDKVVYTVRNVTTPTQRSGDALADAAATARNTRIQLLLEARSGSHATHLGRIELNQASPLSEAADAGLKFSPMHQGGHFGVTRLVRNLRGPAYDGSQRGRAAAP